MSAIPSQDKASSGQFARHLHCMETCSDNAKATGTVIPRDRMRPVITPPDPVLRAYSDLLSHALLFFRDVSGLKGLDLQEVHDLADAFTTFPAFSSITGLNGTTSSIGHYTCDLLTDDGLLMDLVWSSSWNLVCIDTLNARMKTQVLNYRAALDAGSAPCYISGIIGPTRVGAGCWMVIKGNL